MLSRPLVRELSKAISMAYSWQPDGPEPDPEVVFPEKAAYSENFNTTANGTLLRNMDGWAAYDSIASTHVARDQLIIQSGAVVRTAVSADFNTAPGKYVVGRQAPSTDHVFETTLKALPNTGSGLIMVIAATNESNAIFLECTNSAGLMQNFLLKKYTGGVTTSLLSVVGSTTKLGRRLEVGDVITLAIVGTKIHLLVNDLRITPAAGVDTGAYTKGTVCGFGTKTGVNASFDDFYIAPITAAVAVNNITKFLPGIIGIGSSGVLTGTYAGDVQALDYRVVNATTGAVMKDWTRASSPTIAAGVWSLAATVPLCDVVNNPKCRLQVRAANDVDALGSSTPTASGAFFLLYGQSNSAFIGLGGAAAYAAANAYSWNVNAASEWRGGDATTTERSQRFAATLSAALGIPVGVYVGGVPSRSINDLTNGVEWDQLVADVTAAGGYGCAMGVVWTQGENVAAGASVFNPASYEATFDTLIGPTKLRGPLTLGASIPIGVCPIGSNYGGHQNGDAFGDAQWSAVRACHFGLTSKPNIHIAANLSSAVHEDALHYTADAYVEISRRFGMSMRKALGQAGADGRGPIITGATRAGAVVTLAVDLNGASSLSGTALTDYQVSANDFGTMLTVSSAVVSGSTIVLTLSADPGAPIKVRSFWGMGAVWHNMAVRAIGTYPDATTIPTEPLFVPLLAA